MMKIFSNNNGERVYKLRGNMTVEQINAGREHVSLLFAYPTLYVNPYMVITPQGYTKYYYMGTDRVAAQIGKVSHMQSLFADPIELHSDTGTTFVDIDGEAYDELQWQCFGGDRLWQITIACDSDILLPILRRDSGAADTRVSGKYFYHTDHLGSANWVTKGDEVGERLFELMASTLGAAMVEWSHLKTDGDGSGLNYVGTNWAEDKTSIATTIINKSSYCFASANTYSST